MAIFATLDYHVSMTSGACPGYRTIKCDNTTVNRREFIRRARSYARKAGLEFRFDPSHGKGSHGRVYVGKRFCTTVQRGELSRGMLAAMLRQLDIERREF